MRIAVIAGFPPDPYGEAHYAGQVYSSLARQFRDIEILVFAHKNDSAPGEEQVLNNLKVTRITNPTNRFQATIALIPLLYYLIRFGPDIVHFQGTHTPRYGGVFGEPITILIGILRLLGKKVVFTAHSIWLPAELAELWDRHNTIDIFSKGLTWLYGANLRLISRWSNYLSFVVAGEKSPMVDIYKRVYRLTSDKIVSESHPCTGSVVSPQQQLQAKELLGLSNALIVSAIGFIRADKGYHLILDCAGDLLVKYPKLVIMIAGMPQGAEGEQYADLLEQKRQSIPENDRIVLHTEYLSDDDFSTYMEAADVVIVPYPKVMGPSGPIHHALGRGKPVIASALGHNLGLDGVCKLFSAEDSVALGMALDELIQDPLQIEEYRNRSRTYANRHTWDHLAQQYMVQYRSLRN